MPWGGRRKKQLNALLALVDARGRPNMNALVELANSVHMIELNVKAFGYELARSMAAALPPRKETAAVDVGLKSKPSTQADLESDWAAHWASQLKTPVIYHRKLWELVYVLQALHEHGYLTRGAKGVGFGCGVEPIPSYLASRGVFATVTDLPVDVAKAKGWVGTNQHLRTLESAFHAHLVDRDVFERLVDAREADMNAIPETLEGYDFSWSICALEHLGSIDHGLAFIENSLRVLRPGGLSVHTMEYNVADSGPTIDNWITVLFQRKHIESLAAKLRVAGHQVAELDFDTGDKPMDKFIDVPPWNHDLPVDSAGRIGHPYHLKLGIDGFVSTCFGIIVRKAG